MSKLSKRLEVVANFIDDNDKSVIDIGCDHGLLSIYLAEKFKNLKIIASDVNNNALESARRNVSKYKLEDRIDIRLGSGISVINKKDKIDTLVVAGMGANTIIGFLKYSQDKLKDINKIIIQSNTDLFFLRKNMVSMGYYIDDEEFSIVSGLLKDSNIVVGASKYVILSCNYPSTASRINSNLEVTEKLLEKIFNTKVYVVAVDNDRWKGIKNKYIDELKKGIKYNVKELENNANNKREKSSIDDLIDLVGDSIIEYK